MFGKLKPTIDVSSLLVIARYQEALCKNYDDLEQVQMKLPLSLGWRRILHYFTISNIFPFIRILYIHILYRYIFPEKTSDLGGGFQMKRLWRFTATWGRLPVPIWLRLNSFQMGWNHLVTWNMMVLLPKHVFRFLAGAIGIPLMSAMFSHDFGVPHSCLLPACLCCTIFLFLCVGVSCVFVVLLDLSF